MERETSNQETADQLFKNAVKYSEAGDKNKTRVLDQKAAALGHVEAQFDLGALFLMQSQKADNKEQAY